MKRVFNLLILALFVNNTMMPSAESVTPLPSYRKISKRVLRWSAHKDILKKYANTHFEDELTRYSMTPLGMALQEDEDSFLGCIDFLLANGASTKAPVRVIRYDDGSGVLVNPLMAFFGDSERMRGWSPGSYKITDAIKLILRYHDAPSFCVADECIKPEWRGFKNPDPLVWLERRQRLIKEHPEAVGGHEAELVDEIEPLLKKHLLQQRQWSQAREAWCIAVVRGILNREKN